MKVFRCSSAVVLAVAIFFLAQISQALPPPYPANRTVDSPALVRRECVPRPSAPGQFDCDYELPSLSQIIGRMRDGEHGGRAKADTPVFLYTKLGSPYYAVTSMLAWFNTQGNIRNFYSALNALDRPCE